MCFTASEGLWAMSNNRGIMATFGESYYNRDRDCTEVEVLSEETGEVMGCFFYSNPGQRERAKRVLDSLSREGW